MSSEPSSTGWRSIGLLYSDSHICLSVRNWCAQTVTKTVTCQVQNGTTLQRVYQTCRWPQGCNGGRWVYNNTHSLGVYIILGSSLCSLCSKCNGILLFSGHVLIGHSSKNIPKIIKCCMCKVINLIIPFCSSCQDFVNLYIFA